MSAPETGQWLLLSKILGRLPDAQIDAEMHRLMDKIADGRLRIRYFNADDKQTWPRTGHRYEKLPEEFFLSGKPNWKFSMVTLGERTIHQIEVFFPDSDASENARDEPMIAPYQSGGQGRPTVKHFVIAEAVSAPLARRKQKGPRSSKTENEDEGKRLLDSDGVYSTFEAFVEDVHRSVKHLPSTKLGTIREHLRPIWKQRRN
jgi:hypothetical protein